MDVDRPGRDYPPRDGPNRGPSGHQGLLLQHPVPQQQVAPEGVRHSQESYFTRPPRPVSTSVSPPSQSARPRSPPAFQNYPPHRQAIGPAQPSAVPSQRSPRSYPPPGHEVSRSVEQEWERRPPVEHREWDRGERRSRPSEYPLHAPPPPPPTFYPSRSPGSHRAHSPTAPSPRTTHPHPSRHWDKPLSNTHAPPPRPSPPPQPEATGRRYDPRYDGREREPPRDYDDQRSDTRSHIGSPDSLRNPARNPPPHLVVGSNTRASESPRMAPSMSDNRDRRRRGGKEKEPEPAPAPPPPPPLLMQEVSKKETRRKRPMGRRVKDELGGSETPKPFGMERGHHLPSNFKLAHGYSKALATSATAHPPSREINEDYDEGVPEALISLAAGYPGPPGNDGPHQSPTISAGSRHTDPSPRPPPSHRNSVSSTKSHTSPPIQSAALKRALSPGPEDVMDSKRSRMDIMKRRSSPSGRRTPALSTRPSPIPFRTQPASHSPEARQPLDPYPPSPPLPAVLPPHPRPIGAGLASHGSSSGSVPMTLPPIATLSPASTAASPGASADRDERMQVDGTRSSSPGSRSKISDVMHPNASSRSPPAKHTPSPPADKESAA
ncbi:hypothetical protein BD779DRAFT_1800440 [Infundibulicybe gibba]|nr:hypothetical protein BD779DRAFT_1800440 [Infundibulicybe gibba]